MNHQNVGKDFLARRPGCSQSGIVTPTSSYGGSDAWGPDMMVVLLSFTRRSATIRGSWLRVFQVLRTPGSPSPDLRIERARLNFPKPALLNTRTFVRSYFPLEYKIVKWNDDNTKLRNSECYLLGLGKSNPWHHRENVGGQARQNLHE